MKYKEFLRMLFEAENDGDNEGADNGTNNGGNDGAKGGERTYTQAEVDAIVQRKKAEMAKQKDKAVSKAVDEATKLANMSAQERAEAERDQWEQKYNELLAKNTRAELTVQARKMLSDENVNGISDSLVSMLVTDNAETTQANVKNFTKMFKDAVKSAIRDLNRRPSPKAGTTSTPTKADIMKIQDVTERQKLIRENMNLFK